MPTRLAVVLSHPIQYYSPWFRWLRQHTPLEFRVFYLWDAGVTAQRDPEFLATFKWDVDLLSGYDSEFIGTNAARRPGSGSFPRPAQSRMTKRLEAWQPNAILLFGYAYESHQRVIAWARRRGVPLVFRGDSHFLGRPAPGWARTFLLKRLYGKFSAVTYVGHANREYFSTLGVPAGFSSPRTRWITLFSIPTVRSTPRAGRRKSFSAGTPRVLKYSRCMPGAR